MLRSKPGTSENETPSFASNRLGFLLNSESATGGANLGAGGSSTLLAGSEPGLLASTSQSSLQPGRGLGLLSSSLSQGSLLRPYSQYSDLEERVPDVSQRRPDWQPFANTSPNRFSPSRQRMGESPRFQFPSQPSYPSTSEHPSSPSKAQGQSSQTLDLSGESTLFQSLRPSSKEYSSPPSVAQLLQTLKSTTSQLVPSPRDTTLPRPPASFRIHTPDSPPGKCSSPFARFPAELEPQAARQFGFGANQKIAGESEPQAARQFGFSSNQQTAAESEPQVERQFGFSPNKKTAADSEPLVERQFGFSPNKKTADLVTSGVPDIQGRLDAQEKQISRLSDLFEERILHANACVQRLAAEHRLRLDDLQTKVEERGKSDERTERGEIVELKNHMQWAESRIHQLAKRIASNEEITDTIKQEVTDTFKQNTFGTETSAVVRGDLDLLRNELMTLKGSNVVTPKILGDAIDPLRRELRQLAERLVQGLNADLSTIIDTVQLEVKQARDAALRSEKQCQLENSGIKQDLELLSTSVKQELKQFGQVHDYITRKEFNDSTQALNKELMALTNLVSRQELRGGISDGVSRQELRDTSESIRRDLSSLMVEFSKISNHDVARSVLPSERNGVESHKTEERLKSLEANTTRAVDELRADVLQTLREYAEVAKVFDKLQTELPKRYEIAGLVDQAMQKHLNQRQIQTDGILIGKSLCADTQNRGPENVVMMEHLQRDVSDLFGRTSLLRALVVNAAALTADGSMLNASKIAMTSTGSSIPLRPPTFQSDSDLAPRKRSTLTEKRDAATARVSMLMVGKPPAQTVTKDEFLHAVQELRWDLCQIDHMAESGYAAAGKVSQIETLVSSVHKELQTLRNSLREQGQTQMQKFLDMQQTNKKSSEVQVENVLVRLNGQEDMLRKLRNIVEQQCSNQLAATALANPRLDNTALFEGFEPLERDLSVLMSRSSLARALASNAAAAMVATQGRLADLEFQVRGLKTAGTAQMTFSSNDNNNADSREAASLLGQSCINRAIARHSVRQSSKPLSDAEKTNNCQTANREIALTLGRDCITRAAARHSTLAASKIG